MKTRSNKQQSMTEFTRLPGTPHGNDGNRSRDKERLATKVTCPCGGKYTVGQKTTHYKSQKHVAFTTEAGERGDYDPYADTVRTL